MENGKKLVLRLRNILVFILLMNIVLIYKIDNIRGIPFVIGSIVLSTIYFYINIKPTKEKELKRRLRVMLGGYELIIDSIIAIFLEALFYSWIFIIKDIEFSKWVIIINTIIIFFVVGISMFNGFLRVFFTSRQISILDRGLLIFLWWVPLVNIFVLHRWCKKVRHEYIYEKSKEELNKARKENEICKTKYPIVMVHGIFFRDWWLINYWGRIPKTLIINGAELYYGKQQSSNLISKSAEELKANILKVINETGCEKVNIIAHSKGGLDSRYAISCLGLNKYVASLTTINTPHRGCNFVDYLLNKIPKGIQSFIANKYNSTFKKLGDKEPDFLGGVTDLTAKSCLEFNKKVIDADGVLYQSVVTKMASVSSASFPLNLGYLFSKHFDGENDGLVSEESAKWGEVIVNISGSKKGISHGDVIDLTRKDLKDYDVCEFYVDIVKKLKEKGL